MVVVHDGGGVRLLVLQLVPPLRGLEVGLQPAGPRAGPAARPRRRRHGDRGPPQCSLADPARVRAQTDEEAA